MPARHPELPAAVGHAVALRGSARRRAGGLDTESYGSWYAALIDLSLRLAGLGWRNALCDTAFVARAREGVAFEGDLDVLAARWPDWHARLARFLMEDPLRPLRQELATRLASLQAGGPQAELFVGPDDASAADEAAPDEGAEVGGAPGEGSLDPVVARAGQA